MIRVVVYHNCMNNFNKKGFTLIELIIYISLASLIALAITGFFQLSLSSRIKNRTIAEVEQQGVQILNLINQSVVNAININSPTIGASSDSLSLEMSNPSIDPIVFSFSSGNLSILEGGSFPAIVLNSSSVEIQNIKFENISKADTPGIIRIEFRLAYINNSNRQEFDWSRTFYSSISLR